MDRVILGVDPGKSGALAFIFQNDMNRVAVEDMPLADGNISSPALAQIIKRFGPTVAVIELVHSMPKQGVASVFSFGKSFGQAIGVIGALNIPLHFVTPGKWKKSYGLGADKEECRARALALFPACSASFARKKDHGRAEAALIAKYGAETLFPWSAAA